MLIYYLKVLLYEIIVLSSQPKASKYKQSGKRIAVGRITRLCNRVGLQIYGYFPDFSTKVYYK